ncbi:hypothetical protein RFI_20120 [Reticulomyxa filosa]|uniref:Uncharacterized protein n=1 Tax=Reticulomyxa filosa TaxID=46433 RepID=X6MVT1_RETFI|nr:hypothetical protein RFI_20120 [Reticulomyxa filosa]|eukprot:ETO17210.1 hypothetical protein RFI_20120 [Reticulomyxa filosa]
MIQRANTTANLSNEFQTKVAMKLTPKEYTNDPKQPEKSVSYEDAVDVDADTDEEELVPKEEKKTSFSKLFGQLRKKHSMPELRQSPKHDRKKLSDIGVIKRTDTSPTTQADSEPTHQRYHTTIDATLTIPPLPKKDVHQVTQRIKAKYFAELRKRKLPLTPMVMPMFTVLPDEIDNEDGDRKTTKHFTAPK